MQQANPQLGEEQALHLTVHGSNQNEDGTYSWKYDNYTHNFSSAGVSSEHVTELWQCVSAPVLIMNAQHGLEHRIGQGGTEKYFADAQLHEIGDAGHWTYHDQHVQVYTRILQFLE